MSDEEYIQSMRAELDRLKALGCPVGMGSHVLATRQPHWVHAINSLPSKEHLARILHNANTGRITPDPDDATRYADMAADVLGYLRDSMVHQPSQPRRAWRVGRKVGRTIYRQMGAEAADSDPLIGVMDDPSDAALVARAVNTVLRENTLDL